MLRPPGVLYFALLLAVTACRKEGRIPSGGPFPVPDSTTFFPLLPGSFWIYKENNPGDPKDLPYVDSVLSLAETDSGYLAVVEAKPKDAAPLSYLISMAMVGPIPSD